MNTHNPILLVSCFTLLLGCAHASPPAELVEARTAYQRAAKGPAKEHTPAELHVAKDSLAVAERSFEDNEDDFIVRAHAYIARRKAERAESLARTQMLEQGIEFTDEQQELIETEDAKRTRERLAATENALDDTEGALADQKDAVALTEKQLLEEKKLRGQAEKRAALAAADLARIASVKQDERGTVITLSGSVLFASNKYELLPGAQAKLSQVAEALLAGDPNTTFVVEGHTDSQGKAEANQTLSVNRANAVRDYLVAHEIAADRITAEGYGEGRPVAENTNAEGRANNRRVEIVVKGGK